MAATWTETSQMTIRELADFSANLAQTLRDDPALQTKRPAVEEALSAQCIQCSIRIPGADLLNFGGTSAASPQTDSDSKLDRLRMGYCARNGCDSQYYNVTCAPHPQVDWPTLLNAHQTAVAATESATATTTEKAQRFARHHRRFLRTAVAIGVLLLVYVIRQIYVGGTIPLIRQPEQFQVDRESAGGATPPR